MGGDRRSGPTLLIFTLALGLITNIAMCKVRVVILKPNQIVNLFL